MNDIPDTSVPLPACTARRFDRHAIFGGTTVISYVQSFLRTLGCPEQRKARNFLLQPAFQLRLAAYILLLSISFMLLALLLGNLYFEQTYVTMIHNTTQSEYLQQVISQQLHEFKATSLLLLFVYMLLTIAVTTVYTHKLVGPVIPLSRLIRALAQGRYDHRVKLRRNDALQELADELNELAETLEQGNRRHHS
jgi:HAMP domain-containing protein